MLTVVLKWSPEHNRSIPFSYLIIFSSVLISWELARNLLGSQALLAWFWDSFGGEEHSYSPGDIIEADSTWIHQFFCLTMTWAATKIFSGHEVQAV